MRLCAALLLTAAFAACAAVESHPRAPRCNLVAKAPACIAARVDKMCAQPSQREPMSVTRYRYRGQDVYYIPPHCCDIPSELLDAECRIVCMPDGGLTGAGDGKCPDFRTTRAGGEVIWREEAVSPPAPTP
jgi:hypothetical protein